MESLSVPRPHPGTFVREKVIPSGMTVKEAAKRLGIGRQALSNFFNRHFPDDLQVCGNHTPLPPSREQSFLRSQPMA